MTRKDYIALAEAFRQGLQARINAWRNCGDDVSITTKIALHNQIVGYQDAIKMVANTAQADNPAFKRNTFLAECGLIEV